MSLGLPTPYGRANPKQMKFVQGVVATNFDPDRVETAAVLAGYSPVNAKAAALRLLNHRIVRHLIVDAMSRAGITIDAVVSVPAAALTAEDKPGVPDHNVRLRAAEMALRLFDAYPSKKVDVRGELEHHHIIDERTLRLAEEVTGEDVVDADVIEDDDLEKPF